MGWARRTAAALRVGVAGRRPEDGTLRRLRRALLTAALTMALLTAVQVAMADRPVWLRCSAMLALAVWSYWWIRGFRRNRFPVFGDAAEVMLFPLLGVVLNSLNDVFAVFFFAFLYRSLYGGGRAVLSRLCLYLAALAGTFRLLGLGTDRLSQVFGVVASLISLSVLLYLLTTSLRQQEAAIRRERTLTAAGTRLQAADDVTEIHRIAVETVAGLLRGVPGVSATITGPDTGTRQPDGVCWSDGASRPGKARLPGDAVPGAVLTLPLTVGQVSRGTLAIRCDHPVPAAVTAPLRTLAIQVALRLQGVALTEELSEMAHRDPLTGLANRTLFATGLSAALAHAAESGSPAALLLLDLDGFKDVNDSLGHDVGDRLLILVAERLRACVRAGDLVARLGGDEFAVVLEEQADPSDATRTAERVITAFREPGHVDGHALAVRVSIGVAISSCGTESPGDLLRHADVAMYRAKRLGGHGYAVHEDPAPHGTGGRRRDPVN